MQVERGRKTVLGYTIMVESIKVHTLLIGNAREGGQ